MPRRMKAVLPFLLLPMLLAGCWSSQEIEDLALYTGLALDEGQPAPTEKEFEKKSANYAKKNKVMATIQVVPVRSVGTKPKKTNETASRYANISGTGDSIIEIFRQFSIRLDQPIIGHHLKVIVVSADLLKRQTIGNVMDFLLRDNDIRPSTYVFITEGRARDTLDSSITNRVPSFYIRGMLDNRSRTSKVLKPVTLAKVDSLVYAHRSFVLQNIVTGGGELEFAGAGIVKGSSGHWIGTLTQTDVQCLSWLRNEGSSGVIKSEDPDREPITYEIKAMKSKVTPIINGDDISFRVAISTEGRISEIWNDEIIHSSLAYREEAGRIIEMRLQEMMQSLIRKLQSQYKVDVAGFGNQLAIEHPQAWKKVMEDWDEVFSRSKITVTYDLKITDFGSFTEG